MAMIQQTCSIILIQAWHVMHVLMKNSFSCTWVEGLSIYEQINNLSESLKKEKAGPTEI